MELFHALAQVMNQERELPTKGRSSTQILRETTLASTKGLARCPATRSVR